MILHSRTPTSSPAPTSHSQESPVPILVGQSGPSYQPNVYHPLIYTQYYNQGIPYTGTYSVPTIPQPSSPSPMGDVSIVPVVPPHSEPLPNLPPSDKVKSPVSAKCSPGCPHKQPTGGAMSGQGVFKLTNATAKRPTWTGHIAGSQN